MITSKSPYLLQLSSYAYILSINGARNIQKQTQLNFDNGSNSGTLRTILPFIQIVDEKKTPPRSFLEILHFFKIFAKMLQPSLNFHKKYDGNIASSHDQPFLSYAHISCKNVAQILQKWNKFNFDAWFEYGDFENHIKCHFIYSERIRLNERKKRLCYSMGILGSFWRYQNCENSPVLQ